MPVNRNKEGRENKDGRKDNEFGHGGMSEREKEEARKKGGEHSHSGGRRS